MWPAAPVSLVTNFMRGISPNPGLPVAVTFSHASPAGWGWAMRPHHRADPVLLYGRWSLAPALAGAAWMAQPCFTEAGMPCEPVHRQAMAILMGLHAASRRFPLHSFTMVLRTHCASTASALERGSCRDPALQDISMLFQAACLQLKIRRPALMTTPDSVPTRTLPGRPDRSALTDSSTRVMKDTN
jgi:hypothetical protein